MKGGRIEAFALRSAQNGRKSKNAVSVKYKFKGGDSKGSDNKRVKNFFMICVCRYSNNWLSIKAFECSCGQRMKRRWWRAILSSWKTMSVKQALIINCLPNKIASRSMVLKSSYSTIWNVAQPIPRNPIYFWDALKERRRKIQVRYVKRVGQGSPYTGWGCY